jgi:hypothetical protein
VLNILAMHWSMNKMEYIREENYKLMIKKQLRAQYWLQRLVLTMDALRTADANWLAFYDNDENVPDDASNRTIVGLIQAHVIAMTGAFPKSIARMHREIFIWEDAFGIFLFTKEVGKKPLYTLDFNTMNEAKAFIDGLPIHNLGYGVVLDILPAGKLVEADTSMKAEQSNAISR